MTCPLGLASNYGYARRGCRCTDCRAAHRIANSPGHQRTTKKTATAPTAPIRTYGEPWDSRIAAGAHWSVPPSGNPRNHDTAARRREG